MYIGNGLACLGAWITSTAVFLSSSTTEFAAAVTYGFAILLTLACAVDAHLKGR